MSRPKIKLDLDGLEEVAKSPRVDAEIKALAEKVAESVRAMGIRVQGRPGDIPLPVKVYSEDTHDMRVNRARSTVVLAHAAGLAAQAKHGALTKAASAVGLRLKKS